MTTPVNLFGQNLQLAFKELIEEKLQEVSSGATVVQQEDNTPFDTPRVIVDCSDIEEAVFQSGIYKITARFIVHVNLDAADSTDQDEPDSYANLFGYVMDVLQRTDLKEALINEGGLQIMGLALGAGKLDEIGEREWIKSVEMEVFGFSI